MKHGLEGLYAVTPDEPGTELLLDKAAQALRGGARILQYRNKTASAELRREQGKGLAVLCRNAGACFIVNDDLPLALELGADGVHLGAEDGDLTFARAQLGSGRLLGASCYDKIEFAESAMAARVDYIAFGAVFRSATKPDTVHASLSLFAEARRRFSLPLVAIGGITMQNASQVFAAGADCVAVVSALFDAPDIAAAAGGFNRLYQLQRMQQ